MDPLTQGVLGASLPQSTAKQSEIAVAGLLGFLAGMSADLDVLIRSATDPLLFLEYHRQFTHSLIFIPVGGLICALVLHLLIGRRKSLTFARTFSYCTLGYATHALLDACTSYGTMLLWPFSETRFAWNTISIIDPLFTLPILVLVLLGAYRKRVLFARIALLWAVTYMSLGLWQRNSAMDMGRELAVERGHTPLRLEAKPSFANILVWKIVYETPDRYYVDAVRTGFAPRVFPGDSLQKLNIDRDLPWLDGNSQQARDIERFRWFSNGYIARDPVDKTRVIDIRYSLVPNELAPLWSIKLRRGASAGEHAAYQTHRDVSGNERELIWDMMMGGR
jgi:inner membrane protein